MTHRAKLRRLAFIVCPCPPTERRKAANGVPANRGGFTSPVPGNVGATPPPAKGTQYATHVYMAIS
jgi:hypothetical protein